MVLTPESQGWPLERNASWRRVTRARCIVLAVVIPCFLLAAVVGLKAGLSTAGLLLFPLALFGLRHVGASLARDIDKRYPLHPLVDPPPEPPPPLKPSLFNALLAAVLGGVGWSAVAFVVRLALVRLEGSPAVGIVWACFVALAAWSLARAFIVNLRPPVDAKH